MKKTNSNFCIWINCFDLIVFVGITGRAGSTEVLSFSRAAFGFWMDMIGFKRDACDKF